MTAIHNISKDKSTLSTPRQALHGRLSIHHTAHTCWINK